MNITSGQKKAAIIGAAVLLVAGAAFVYFDPLGLNLLGESTTAVKPAAPALKPGAAPSASQPTVAVPKSVAAPAQAPAQAIAPAVPPATPATPATPAKTAMPAATPVAPPPVSVPAMQPPAKQPEAIKTSNKSISGKLATNKPDRPKNLDLRHCLELETPAAIAKCAGE